MIMEHINYFAVLVSAIAYMALGAFWFSPVAFGKQWQKMMKLTKKDLKPNKYAYLSMFGTNLVVFWVMAFFISFLEATTFVGGASVAFMAWLGFIAPIGVSGMLWEKKSFDLFVLQNSYCLLGFILLGGMLAVWR